MRVLNLSIHYSDDTSGPLSMYLYDEDGFHHGARTLSRPAVERTIESGQEVRITNADDFCVFHAREGQVIHPQDAAEFWRSL